MSGVIIVGIPDESGLRATAWKLLLGYLPPDKRTWSSSLCSQRLSYYVCVMMLHDEEPRWRRGWQWGRHTPPVHIEINIGLFFVRTG